MNQGILFQFSIFYKLNYEIMNKILLTEAKIKYREIIQSINLVEVSTLLV